MSLGHGASIVRDGLVLHLDAASVRSYPGSGTTWTDMKGSVDGTMNGGVLYTNEESGAMIFDGTDDYISIPDESTRINGIEYSYDVVFYFDGNSQNAGLCGKRKSVSNYAQYSISLSNGNPYVSAADTILTAFGRTDLSNGDRIATHDLSTTGAGVYHVSVVNNASELKLYVNGDLKDTSTTSQSGTYNITGYDFRVGNTYTNSYFSGRIYSTKIYNRALTPQEVKNNYLATKSRYGL